MRLPSAKQSTHSEQAFRFWLIRASIETHVQREATCFSAAGEPRFCGDTQEVLPGDQPNLPLHPPANLSLAGTAVVAQRDQPNLHLLLPANLGLAGTAVVAQQDQPNLPPRLPVNPCKGSPRKEPFGIAMESLLYKLRRCFFSLNAKQPPVVGIEDIWPAIIHCPI